MSLETLGAVLTVIYFLGAFFLNWYSDCFYGIRKSKIYDDFFK
jgi:hypothetical protein